MLFTGDRLTDSEPPSLTFHRSTSYVEQKDVREPAQIVREALRFFADLGQSFDIPQKEQYAYIEEVSSLMKTSL